jgi:hypothetical protein
MAIQFRCESLSSRFQNPGDEAYSERKLQVRFDPLLGTSARIAEGVKLQTSVDAALVSFRAHRQSNASHRHGNHAGRTHSGWRYRAVSQPGAVLEIRRRRRVYNTPFAFARLGVVPRPHSMRPSPPSQRGLVIYGLWQGGTPASPATG